MASYLDDLFSKAAALYEANAKAPGFGGVFVDVAITTNQSGGLSNGEKNVVNLFPEVRLFYTPHTPGGTDGSGNTMPPVLATFTGPDLVITPPWQGSGSGQPYSVSWQGSIFFAAVHATNVVYGNLGAAGGVFITISFCNLGVSTGQSQ